jgi:uncharacterized membrane protein HdeD (DUF308 family)
MLNYLTTKILLAICGVLFFIGLYTGIDLLLLPLGILIIIVGVIEAWAR